MTTLPLSAIHVSDEQRANAHPALLKHGLDLFEQHMVLLPVQVSPAHDGYRLLNGVERLMVAERMGMSSVPVFVEPRTADEKRQAVQEFLAEPIWQGTSTAAIARYCYVRREMVIALRAGMPRSEQVVRADGKPYPLKQTAPSLHAGPYAAATIPDGFADVVITALPGLRDIDALAERLAGHLKVDTGAAYLLFNAEGLSRAAAWQKALEGAGLDLGGLIAWTSARRLEQSHRARPGTQAGASRFELVLAMGHVPEGLRGQPLLRIRDTDAPRVALAQRLLAAPGRADLIALDPFVRDPFVLQAARRLRIEGAIGYLLDERYRAEVEQTLQLP